MAVSGMACKAAPERFAQQYQHLLSAGVFYQSIVLNQ
jgi:hypothetical protein